MVIGLLFFVGLFQIITNQNSVIKLLFPSKVWVHRVNSIDKLSKVGSNYRGIELDVEFDEAYNKFQVNHPPAKPINLFLETYLKNSDLNKKYWIDLKNLDNTNLMRIKLQLMIVLDSLKLNKNNFIIESPNCEELSRLKSEFDVSYYLPVGLSSLNTKQQKMVSDTIRINLRKYKPNYISSSIVDYYYMRKEFDYNMLLWALSELKINTPDGFLNGIRSLKVKLSALLDDQVKVVLVGDM